VTEVDITLTISLFLSTKDSTELRAMRTSSKACVALMTPYFLEEMSSVLDAGKKVKHSALAEKVDKMLDDGSFWKKVELPNKTKLPAELDPTQLDWVTGPVVQSGGKYDLRLTQDVNDDVLHPGTIIAAMGLRYKSYSSSIARTFLIDPNKAQESSYKVLFNVHNAVLKEIRDGVVAKDVYAKALSIIKAKKPELEKHFLKNVGWGIGLETKDNTLLLNAKNTRVLRDGMTLCITTGFQDIENPNPQDKQSKVYSLLIMDTIRVSDGEPVVFTVEAPIEANSNSFFFKDEEEEKPTPKKEKKDHRVGAVATKNITATRLRSERSTQVDEENESKRRKHQKELAAKKQKEGLRRFAESTAGQNGVEAKKFKKFESYKRDNQFPTKSKDLKIVVDTKSSTIVVPIMGRPVPFHINTIKNASVNDEGDFVFLRINFLSPGQGVGRKDDQPFEDASAHFMRSLTFRSEDKNRYTEIATVISNMKRDAVKKEQEKKDMEDVVEQDKLVEIRSKLTFKSSGPTDTKGYRSTTAGAGQRLHQTRHGGQAGAGEARDPPERYPLPIATQHAAASRYPLFEHSPSIFPTVPARAHCGRARPSQGPHHRREQEEDQGCAVLPGSHRHPIRRNGQQEAQVPLRG
jgi:nucleosome binding factor SPN SPT16 subunit